MIDENGRYVRRSIRLPRFDYAQPGMYYVTMVTHRRENHFGDIRGGSVFLNVFGKIANYFWQLLPDHFPHIELDEFIVMPNHIHGVIAINRPPGAINRPPGAINRAPTQGVANNMMGSGALGEIVRWFKGCTTFEINHAVGAPFMAPGTNSSRSAGAINRAPTVWQRNYYEHVIRNETDLERIREYIRTNPEHWDEDENNL